jgi:hypothetical protein
MASIISSVRTLTDSSFKVRREKASGPLESTMGCPGTGTTTPPAFHEQPSRRVLGTGVCRTEVIPRRRAGVEPTAFTELAAHQDQRPGDQGQGKPIPQLVWVADSRHGTHVVHGSQWPCVRAT